MFRHIAIFTVGLVAIANLNAGSLGINPGDYLNPDGTVSIGLLPNVGTPSGSGLVSNPDGITGTNWAARSYYTNTSLLNKATITGGVPQSNVTCLTNCQGGITVTTPTPGTATIYSPAAAPEFNLLGDGALNTVVKNDNAWLSLSTGTGASSSLITIPIGIFGVQSVSTMLNTVAGIKTGGTIGDNPAAYASITFNFQDAADYALGNGLGIVSETLALINGVTQRNIFDGYASANYANSLCTGANTAAATCAYTATDLGTAAGAQYTVKVGNEWTGFVATGGNSNIPVNTPMVLDYQTFAINSNYWSDVLVNVSITDTGGGISINNEVLSGLTVVATPEPSTVLMFLTGLGIVGIARFRRIRS